MARLDARDADLWPVDPDAGTRPARASRRWLEPAWHDVDAVAGWDDLPGDHGVMWIESALFELLGGHLVPVRQSLSSGG